MKNIYLLRKHKKIRLIAIIFITLFFALQQNGGAQCISTIAGNGIQGFSGDGGPAILAKLSFPTGIAIDASGNLYITGIDNRIRKISAAGIITTIAGTGVAGFSGDGGPAVSAQIFNPYGIAIDASHNVYFSDFKNHRIRRINGSTGIITTIAGTGTGGFSGDGGAAISAKIDSASGLVFDAGGTNLYFGDQHNFRIRKINMLSGIITTIAGTGVSGFSGDGGPAASARIAEVGDIRLDAAGDLYFGDGTNNRIRKISAGIISTFAGNGSTGYTGDGGPATSAAIGQALSLTNDYSGNFYITNVNNACIRRIEASTGIITTIAGTGKQGYSGDGGPAYAATVREPWAIVFDGSNNLYFTDVIDHRVRKISGGASLANLPNLGVPGIITTTMVCNDTRGYIGFIDPANPSHKLAAIEPNGNNGCSFAVTVDPSRNIYSVKTDRNFKTTSLMPRMVNVVTGGCTSPFTVNGGMRVRIYYSQAEKANTIAALDPAVTGPGEWAWFKYEGTAAAVVANQNDSAFSGIYKSWLIPDSSGIENGINFAEFWNVTSFSTFGGFAYKNFPNIAVPLGLEEFRAAAINAYAIQLDWTISSEQNTDHIIIERSIDGRTFSETGRLPATSNASSPISYSYTDNNPQSPINYYRLAIVEKNGTTTYSDIRKVKFDNNNDLVKVYPVPVAAGQLTVNASALQAGMGRLTIHLINDLGQPVLSQMIQAGTSKIFSTSGIAKGTYMLKLTGSNGYSSIHPVVVR